MFLQPKWPFFDEKVGFHEKIAMVPPYDHVILQPFFRILAGVLIKMPFFRVRARLVAVFEKMSILVIFFHFLV